MQAFFNFFCVRKFKIYTDLQLEGQMNFFCGGGGRHRIV